jgi:hypothetical protein
MPHHDDDLEDPTRDVFDWLTRKMQQQPEPGGAHAPGPQWGPKNSRVKDLAARLVVLLVAVALSWLGIEQFRNDEGPTHTLTTRREVNVYEAPSFDSLVVQQLSPDQRVLASERTNDGWVVLFKPDSTTMGYAIESEENFGNNNDDSSTVSLPPSPPAPAPAPRDTTAVCMDGWISHSKRRSGTCAGHGGVEVWLHRPRQ